MDELTINKSDIGETMVYDWTCPSCGSGNEEWDSEPTDDYPLYCESCGSNVLIID